MRGHLQTTMAANKCPSFSNYRENGDIFRSISYIDTFYSKTYIYILIRHLSSTIILHNRVIITIIYHCF